MITFRMTQCHDAGEVAVYRETGVKSQEEVFLRLANSKVQTVFPQEREKS